MFDEGLDPLLISKLTSQQVEQVTCSECYKYFISPETASCGHTLCHSCWKGRRTCHVCAAPVVKKALKVNIPLQTLTEHVHALADTFEKVFNLKLEELTLENLDDLQSEDPTKNVKEWLASSQNHFSAPVISSLNSEQPLINSQNSKHEPIMTMELSKSNFQVHARKKKIESLKKVVRPPEPQDDWDIIEVLPDTDEVTSKKPKEHGAGPMDIEPFFLDEYEYTSDNPRRSSRKREGNADSNPQDVSVDKISSGKNSSYTKSHKSKQIWSNVKKMKKEFSKLNKTNKSKLNVSIEMAKKAAATKQKSATPPRTDSENKIISIDDNTPVADCINKGNEITPENVSKNNNKNLNSVSPSMDDEDIIEIDAFDKNHSISNNRDHVNDMDIKDQSSKQNKHSQSKQNDNLHEKEMPHSFVIQNRIDNNVNIESPNFKKTVASISNTAVKPVNMPFIKKSALCEQFKSTNQNDVQITQKEIEKNNISANTDDIEISIRIGNTVTNIVIKNKNNDVQFKVNTDQGIQASLGPFGLIEKNDAANSPIQELNVQNIEEKNTLAINKSFSTKKNTASADTATAQFEMTDSMERELSDVMECLERKRKGTQTSRNTQQLPKVFENVVTTLNQKSSKISNTPGIGEPEVEVEQQITDIDKDRDKNLDDVDIFNSGSVKDGNSNVHLLKDTKKVASEILVSTVKSKRSQKGADKRNRESKNDEQPDSKKLKIDLDKIDEDKEDIPAGVSDTLKKQVQDSENMNYDVIMSQVFANIDADIEISSKKKNTNMTTQVLKEKSYDTNLVIATESPSQIIYNTPNIPPQKENSDIEMRNESKEINQKYSENVFSMLEKDSEPVEKDVSEQTNKKVPTSTQQHIDNLLTPGMCRDLVATRGSQSSLLMDKMEELVAVDPDIGTLNIDNDDSDKSIVEETPQKMSFTKPKQNDIIRTKSSNQKEQSRNLMSSPQENLQSQDSKISDSQIIRSIINISDTTMKDATVLNADKIKLTSVTPFTINKFVNHIKHNSTPVARKSLSFETENIDDPKQTLCPPTTQEKEFLADTFKQTPTTPIKRPLTLKNMSNRKNLKFFVAGSCLSSIETKSLKLLCQERGWTYLDKYSKELTYLVVGVDEENKSQRSVKYMCALAASKWIVSYCWVEKCLQLKTVVDELPYEALDACGEPGPRRSRTAIKKIFEGMVFYCMPPFSVLDLNALKQMLESAGGRVVDGPEGVKVNRESGSQVLLLLAEPEHTQEDRFVYLAMEHSVVPVNYEWALNCLGTYTLCSVHDLLLCPSSLLPTATSNWPAVLLLHEDDDY